MEESGLVGLSSAAAWGRSPAGLLQEQEICHSRRTLGLEQWRRRATQPRRGRQVRPSSACCWTPCSKNMGSCCCCCCVSWGLFMCMPIYMHHGTARSSSSLRNARVGNMLARKTPVQICLENRLYTTLRIVFLMTKTQLTQHYI